MQDSYATVIGFVAGLLSTASFVPQVIKAWRSEDVEGVSRRMYMVNLTSFTLWTIYGFLISSLPVMIFNTLCLALSTTILCVTLRKTRTA